MKIFKVVYKDFTSEIVFADTMAEVRLKYHGAIFIHEVVIH